jgi:hypothetical protein
MSILAPLFDAFRRYRKTQGYILIDCLRRLAPGVLVRVVQRREDAAAGRSPAATAGSGSAKSAGDSPSRKGEPRAHSNRSIPLISGSTRKQDRFDVIVDEAPSSPNQKEQTWAALQPFMAGLARTRKAIAVALKYSPLPLSAAQELAEAMTDNGLPPEVQQQMQQGQQLIAQLHQENTRSRPTSDRGGQGPDHGTARAGQVGDRAIQRRDRPHPQGGPARRARQRRHVRIRDAQAPG